jgi:hypothetical protein
MREASGAPRNSRELAVRNQFFTPRYVVQFLTDNSLGRIWYEMTQGQTMLSDHCPYLIKRPGEVFLKKGEAKPENANTDIHYVEYREIKDPRDIKMLDPACGSMHFGLYAFDVFEHMYTEAWDKYPHLLTGLRDKFTRDEFLAQIPGLIIRHNIHGVDIDARALQIAGLSLWLRAQKSYDRLGLQPISRPAITRSNLVLAEPMPGNETLLNNFLKQLAPALQPLVREIWNKMQLAGETGLLLRIEHEIKDAVEQARKKYIEARRPAKPIQTELFGETTIQKEIDFFSAKPELNEKFFETAENEILLALKELATQASNGEEYQTLLFAEDTQRGFAFIELCRHQYDVVLMNPPFGETATNTQSYIRTNYPNFANNVICAFIERMKQMIGDNGFVSSIYDRVLNINSSYESFRRNHFCGFMAFNADTGWNVLDANVETTCTVFTKVITKNSLFFNLLDSLIKENNLKSLINSPLENSNQIFTINTLNFLDLPNAAIGYNIPVYIFKLFNNCNNLEKNSLVARQGHSLVAIEHFRIYWEPIIYDKYSQLFNGSDFTHFYNQYRDISLYGLDGKLVKYHKSAVLRNINFQNEMGVGFGRRGEILDTQILKLNFLFTSVGLAFPKLPRTDSIIVLSFTNSIFVQYIINLYCGQHKQAGYLNLLPFPVLKNIDLELIKKAIIEIVLIKRNWFSLDETCLEFHHLLYQFTKCDSLKNAIRKLQEKLIEDKQEYLSLIKQNDDFWLQQANIPEEALSVFEAYKTKRPNENLISIDGVTDETLVDNPNMVYEIISNLLGVVYGRWDIRSIQNPELIPPFGDFFDALPFMPVVSLNEVPENYPVAIPIDGILVSDEKHTRDICLNFIKAIYLLWPTNGDKILNELCEIGQFNNLEDFF